MCRLTGPGDALLNCAFIAYYCAGYALVPGMVIIGLSEVHSLQMALRPRRRTPAGEERISDVTATVALSINER